MFPDWNILCRPLTYEVLPPSIYWNAPLTHVWIHPPNFLFTMSLPMDFVVKDLYKIAPCCFGQIMEATPHKTTAIRQLTSYLTNHSRKTKKTCRVLLEKQIRNFKHRSSMEPLHIDEPLIWPTRTYISFVLTLDVFRNTFREQWMIGTDWLYIYIYIYIERERERERIRELRVVSAIW